MTPEAIAELKTLTQWVCWRYETKPGADKPTKVPYQPSGARASSTDPATWSAYDQVVRASIPFDGVGVVLSERDPFCGIDLDGCITDDRKLWGWAELIVAGFKSYTEVTPSGKGVRIWIRAAMPGRGRSKKLGDGAAIEVYDRGRFFTITGRLVPGLPTSIESRQEQLDGFLAAQFPESAPPAPRAPHRPIHLSDRGLIDKAMSAADGRKFSLLWNGDWRGAGYGSQSEADLALCAILRFWTGADSDAMDRLFRLSGLYREKWDEMHGRETYGAMTITKALSGGGDLYDPTRAGASPPHRPTPPQRSEPETDDGPPIHNTDLGNARRLVARHGERLRYTEAQGWMKWAAGHWLGDITGAVERRGKETVAAMYRDASGMDGDERKALAAWALKSESARAIKAMIELAKTEPGICVREEEFDANPMLLNCKNGTVELPGGRLREHRREDLITKMVPVPYDPDATCPRWERFLLEVTQGDERLVSYLQRAVGYSLTGDIREQKLFFLYGIGANGKTTFMNVIQHVLGDYATTAAPGLLIEHRNEQHPTAIADLHGRRLVLCSEVGEGKRMAEELVKRLTGNERLKGRRMHRDFFEFAPQYKLWLAANHKPLIQGSDEGIWRRIDTIPFTAVFHDADNAPEGAPVKDMTLFPALLAELPGILAWAVRGCLEWQRQGLSSPPTVQEATRGYREEMDILGGFLSDRCIQESGAWATAGALYAAYQAWCNATGEQPVTQTSFGRKLKERGFSQVRDRNIGRFWQGIGILDETISEDPRLSDA